MLRIKLGLARRKPVTSKIAARHESGIRLSTAGKATTATNSSTPCPIAESLVFAPACTLTEPRMITEVIGIPPSKPAAMLPAPWASSSRLGGDFRCSGSSRSIASKLSSDSSEATIAIVIAAV